MTPEEQREMGTTSRWNLLLQSALNCLTSLLSRPGSVGGTFAHYETHRGPHTGTSVRCLLYCHP
jgi:hypothetical protein